MEDSAVALGVVDAEVEAPGSVVTSVGVGTGGMVKGGNAADELDGVGTADRVIGGALLGRTLGDAAATGDDGDRVGDGWGRAW